MPKDIAYLDKSKFGWAAASTYFTCAIITSAIRIIFLLPTAYNILVEEFNKGTPYGDIAHISMQPFFGIGFGILVLLLSTLPVFIMGYLFAYFYNKS